MQSPPGISPAPSVSASATESGKTPLLELVGVSKSFGAVEALVDVDFEVFAGEVVAIVGDNGAGKTTLIKTIAGSHRADAGRMLFEGEEVRLDSPTDARGLGIETVYQDLALCDNLDVVANMYLGRESVGSRVPRLLKIEMERRARETLSKLSVTTIGDARLPVAALSGGQRQSVAISRAVMWDSKVVLLDEPTAALGVLQTQQVLDLIKRLRDQNLAVVVISHNLHDVFEVADRIVVLRLGRRVATFDRNSATANSVVAAITGLGAAAAAVTGKSPSEYTSATGPTDSST